MVNVTHVCDECFLPFKDDLTVGLELRIDREDGAAHVVVLELPVLLGYVLHDTTCLHVRIQASTVVLDPWSVHVKRVGAPLVVERVPVLGLEVDILVADGLSPHLIA